MLDAEALFFVDDDQAQIGELDIFGEQAVGADEDVKLAGTGAFKDFLDLSGGFETGNGFDEEGITGDALTHGFFVLLGQYRCGDEDCDLFSELDDLEGGAHGDFGFAVANVAAEEAVHGAGAGEVIFDFIGGFGLVLGGGVGKGVFEFLLPDGIGGKGGAGGVLAGGLDFEHFGGELFDGLGDFFFLLAPACAAESGERRPAVSAADVFLYQVDLRDGDVKHGAAAGAGEAQGEKFRCFSNAARLIAFTCDRGHAFKFCDAVMDVDHVIARLKVEGRTDGPAALDGAEAAAGGVAVEDFVVANKNERSGRRNRWWSSWHFSPAVPFEAEVENADGHFDLAAGVGVFYLKQIAEARAFGFGIADHDNFGAIGELGEFADGFFGLGVEALDGFGGEADSAFVPAELMDLGPGEVLNVFEDGARRIDAPAVA